MPPEIKARELLTLLLDDEEYNSNRGPRSIVGFEDLLEKLDRICDAITKKGNGHDEMAYPKAGDKTSTDADHNHTLLEGGKTSVDGEPAHDHDWSPDQEKTSTDAGHNHCAKAEDDDYDSNGEYMMALTENMQGLRALMEREPAEHPENSEMQKLLTMIAKNTMRRQRSWEFDIQRDRRTGFTEKIIARPVGE